MLLLPLDSTYIQPIDLYEMKLGLTVLSLFVHALFFFIFSHVSSIFGILGIMSELAILFGVLMGKLKSIQ